MWEKLLLLFLISIGILQWDSFVSAERGRTHTRQNGDYIEADGFFFDGPVGKPSGSNINDNLKSTTFSPNPTPAHGSQTSGRPVSQYLFNTFPDCLKKCSTGLEKKPLCGKDGITYDNPKQVQCARMCGKYVRIIFEGPCSFETATMDSNIPIEESPVFQSCRSRCPTTADYNPVCGTDGKTYGNAGSVHCAQECGKNIQIAYHERCT